ncbi:MAG: tetratricopeptide repeat protein [Myxococcota bacterium]
MMLWLCVGLALAQEPGATSPADRERAAELFRNGDKLYNEGNYEGAIVAFREALDLSGEKVLHFNIANCLEVLGKLDEAHQELELYRAVAPADEQATLDRRLASIQQRLEAKQRQAAARPKPEPVEVPVPVPVPVPVVPDKLDVKAATWALAGSGAAIGVASLTGLVLSYRGIGRHQAPRDQGALSLDRAANAVSWLGLGAGAGLTVTGIVVVGPGQLGVAGTF